MSLRAASGLSLQAESLLSLNPRASTPVLNPAGSLAQPQSPITPVVTEMVS
jgi:hypothetical protein